MPELVYKAVGSEQESECRMSAAFDVLFELVSAEERSPQEALDSYAQLGVGYKHDISDERRGGEVFESSRADRRALAEERQPERVQAWEGQNRTVAHSRGGGEEVFGKARE